MVMGAKPFRPFLVSVITRQEVVGREGLVLEVGGRRVVEAKSCFSLLTPGHSAHCLAPPS